MDDQNSAYIESTAKTAILGAKIDRAVSTFMTYLVSTVGFLVGAVCGIVFLALTGQNLGSYQPLSDTDRLKIYIVPIIFGVVFFVLCRMLLGKFWIQAASAKTAEIEKLEADRLRTQNPDERKNLEAKMLKTAFGSAAPTAEALQKLEAFKAKIAAAKTPEERDRLKEEMDDELTTAASGTPLSASATFLFMMCLVPMFGLSLIHPLRYFETFILMELISLPLAGVIVFMILQKNSAWPYKPQKSATSTSIFDVRRILCFFAITYICASFGLGLNQWLDYSAAAPQSFMIIDKHISTGKSGTHYHLKIQSPMESPIASVDFGGQEDVQINAGDYDHVVPGSTKITLNIANGFFHLPWYSSTYSLSPM